MQLIFRVLSDFFVDMNLLLPMYPCVKKCHVGQNYVEKWVWNRVEK